MDFWIPFWMVVLVLSIGAFAASMIAIIPLGARDIWTLLRRLSDNDDL
jgi:hypothetical protein